MLNTPIGNEIEQTYSKFLSTIQAVPALKRGKKVIDGTGGKVSVFDLIAYQIGWGTLLIGWYKAGIKGEIPKMPGEGFNSWDYVGIAQHFYKKYRYDENKKQLAAFDEIVNTILEIVEMEHQTGNLDKAGVWEWCTLASGKQWPLSKWIKVNTASPYKRAARLIRKSL